MKKLIRKAHILCIANIALDGVANGTQGLQDFVTYYTPLIRLIMELELPRYCWQSEDYPTIGFKQYPVVLAWATIYKMQGSSLDQAIMDLGSMYLKPVKFMWDYLGQIQEYYT